MSLSTEAENNISGQLYESKQPLTYRLLARRLRISNSAARALLEEYYEKYKEAKNDLVPTYLISGLHTHRADEDKYGDWGNDEGSILIKLSKLADLEESKSQFSKVSSCSIYSLAGSDFSLENIVEINGKIGPDGYSEEMCKICGVIRTPAAGRREAEPVEVQSNTNTGVKADVKAPAPAKTKPDVKPTVKKEEKDPFAWYKKRKSVSPKKSPEVKRAKVVVDEGVSESTRKQEKELENMFGDMDEDMEDTSAMDVDTTTEQIDDAIDATPEPELEEEQADVTSASQKSAAGRMEEIEQNFLSGKADDEEPAKSAPVKTYVDEDGYVVTLKDKAAPKRKRSKSPAAKEAPKEAPAPAATSHTIKKKAKPKQASLMSFFGKKKV